MNHKGTIPLATERLTLRRFEVEDAEQCFYNWQNDPEVTKYLTWQPYESVEQVSKLLEDWIARYEKNDYYMWAIELNELEQPIGSISAVHVNDDMESVEIGYCIGKAFWHKGYMTEALTAVVRFFLEEVGFGRVAAFHDTRNIYSGKVMAAAGME